MVGPITAAYLAETVISSVAEKKRKRKLKRIAKTQKHISQAEITETKADLYADWLKAQRKTRESEATRGFAGTPTEEYALSELERETSYRQRMLDLQSQAVNLRYKAARYGDSGFTESLFRGISEVSFNSMLTEWQKEKPPAVDTDWEDPLLPYPEYKLSD